MEAAVHRYQFPYGIFPSTSSLTNNQHRPNPENAFIKNNVVLPMRRISTNIIAINPKFQHTKFFSVNVSSQKHMATKNNQPHESSTTSNINKKEEEEKVKENADAKKLVLPPPPEKPEPGDCCGSGCVRCVWDVYYDELDAYNKLYKTDSDTSNSKP